MPSQLAGHLQAGRKSRMAKFFYVINKFSIAYQPMKPNSQLHTGFFVPAWSTSSSDLTPRKIPMFSQLPPTPRQPRAKLLDQNLKSAPLKPQFHPSLAVVG